MALARTPLMMLGACLVLVACGDKEEGDSAAGTDVIEDDTYQTIHADVLELSCAFGGCHGGGAGGLVIDADTTRDDLVGLPSATKEGAVIIVAGDSAGSYLLAKMRGDSDIDGTVMPQGGALPDETLARVAAWIDAGAPE